MKYNKICQTDKLDNSLKEIERFYYSDFWINRFKKRLREENIDFSPIELDRILGTISYLKDDTIFKSFKHDSKNGVSNKGTMIALNINLGSNIDNIIMHEFGHRQYNQKEFDLIKYLNKLIINHAGLYIKNNQSLTKNDYPYFTNDNELRQRIIPIIKEMYDNNWDAQTAYKLSENLERDDIKNIFTKEYIIYLLENLL